MSSTATKVHGYAVNTTYTFASRNVKLTHGRVIHRVHWESWIDGAKAPAPACGAAVGGWSPWVLEPTTGSVTCRRCLQASMVTVAPQHRDPQLELFPPEAV